MILIDVGKKVFKNCFEDGRFRNIFFIGLSYREVFLRENIYFKMGERIFLLSYVIVIIMFLGSKLY